MRLLATIKMKKKFVLTLLTLIYVMSCSEKEDPNGGVLNEYDEEDWLDPFDLTPLRKQKTSEFISEKLIENVDKFSRGVLCIWSATNLLWSLLILFRRLFSFRSWNLFFIVILVLCFLISVPWNWYRMYKENLALKSASLLMNIPHECNPESLTAFGSIKLWLKDTFSTADNLCVKYHKDILVDTFWEVSPLSAFLVSASTLVGEPLKYFFHTLVKSYDNLLAKTPLLWQPVIFFVPLIFGMLIVLLYFGKEIKTILFTIGFGNNRRDDIRLLEDKIQDLKTKNNELENRLRIRNENPIAIEDLPERGLEGIAQAGNFQSRLNRLRIESGEARAGLPDDPIAYHDDIVHRHGNSPQDVSISTSRITRLPGVAASSSSNPDVGRRSNSLDPENVTSEPSRVIGEPVEHEEYLFERRESNTLDRESLSENNGVQEVRSNAANVSHEVSKNDSFPSMDITTSIDIVIVDPE